MSRALQDDGSARRALQVMEARRTGRETDLLHHICHELLSTADLSNVMHNVLVHLTAHLGSAVGYLRVVDHEQPHLPLEAIVGLTGRELDAMREWLQSEPRPHAVHSLAAARQERPEDTYARFAVPARAGVEGVLVLDRRPVSGPTAVEEQRVISAITSLLSDAVRYRRELSRVPGGGAPTDIDTHPGEDLWGAHGSTGDEPPPSTQGALKTLLFAYEREILINALRDADGNQSRAARALDTTPRILTYRLKRHGLHGVLTKGGR